MIPDITQSTEFLEAQRRTADWLRPGTGTVVDLADIAAAPDALSAAATGVMCEKLEGSSSTRIVIVDLASGDMRTVSEGPNNDRLPRWAPDGNTLAFLSDRAQAYITRLYLLDPASGEARAAGGISGMVEYHHWSADGKSLLLGVAGLGADLAGAQGGFSIATRDAEQAAWMPEVDNGIAYDSWRSVWIYDLASDSARRVSPDGVNIWEAVWCGGDHFAGVFSDSPAEESWYGSKVGLFAFDGGEPRVLFAPADQLGWLSAKPDGTTVAVVEAVCSDRTIVAGDLRLIDVTSGAVTCMPTLGADITSTTWRGNVHLLMTAGRGGENLVVLLDVGSGDTTELWSGHHVTPGGGHFAKCTGFGSTPQHCLFMREGWTDAPALIVLADGCERIVRSFDATKAETDYLGQSEYVKWFAPDGLEIHGWLLTPPGPGPHPVVLNIHGGPVWFFRPHYLGKSIMYQMLLSRGYAVFEVNPRGSSGRGQEYARRVFGDMGGADTYDFLSGIDMLVARGTADPARIGLTGGSYGGFMSSWLVTQDSRFAAAVPVAPVTNWVSEHLTCHIGHFCSMFLEDDIDNPTGKYFTRSPVHYAKNVRTPTLNICGALDKNTPPGQAIEFHHALLANGQTSSLVKYPLEGHGVRTMPASFDCLARTVGWFEKYMPAQTIV